MTWHTTRSAESWLADQLRIGPRNAFLVRERGPRNGYRRERVVDAAEALGVGTMRDARGQVLWYLPPATKFDALRRLDALNDGRIPPLRGPGRRRVESDAMRVAGMGRCYCCSRILPLEQLFEDGVGLGCDPCSEL